MNQATFSLFAEGMRHAAVVAARRAGCISDDAEDVASDVMITLWLMRDRLETKTCNAYAGVAARHKALNHLRDRAKERFRIDDADAYDSPSLSPPSPEDLMINDEDIAWFFNEIDNLPSTQQTILKLRQVEMLEKDEIALRLGITEQSVSTLLSRARRTMFNAIKKRMSS